MRHSSTTRSTDRKDPTGLAGHLLQAPGALHGLTTGTGLAKWLLRRQQRASVTLVATLSFLLVANLTSSGAVFASLQTVWSCCQSPFAFAAFDQQGAAAGLARGRFLVASRTLSDPNFAETVVLLIDYDRKGAIGLIVNRPTDVRLATVLPHMTGLQQRPDTVYLGGPVERQRLVLLIRADRQPAASQPVLEHVYVSTSRETLERLANPPEATERFRAYAGYAGWSPGQLEREVSRGAWHIVPADAETVFDRPSADIWPALIQKSAIRWLSF